MLKNSFIFLDKIGKKLERKLWQSGIPDWDSFLNAQKIPGLSTHRKIYYDRMLMHAKKCLYNFDINYLQSIFPRSESWRFYEFFKENAVFLDIETSGLDFENDITVFGLYDGLDTKIMIKGINLDYNLLKAELQKYKLIVTFNGAAFDIPFIEKRYPGILPKIPNFDVRCIAQRLGLKGGLKQIEKTLGIKRKEIVQDFNGGDALTLWRMYRATGNEYYLNLLVEYNEFDVVNLKLVADKCVKMMREKLLCR